MHRQPLILHSHIRSASRVFIFTFLSLGGALFTTLAGDNTVLALGVSNTGTVTTSREVIESDIWKLQGEGDRL
jgi:hypothetical protein